MIFTFIDIVHISQPTVYSLYYLYFIGSQDLQNEEDRKRREKQELELKLKALKEKDKETSK